MNGEQKGDILHHSRFKVPEDTLVIISIGSTQQAELQDAQRATFGKHVKAHYFDEGSFPDCTLCNKSFYESSRASRVKYFYESTLEHATDPLFDKGEGWSCAQKRPLEALKKVLKSLEAPPKWMMVVYDDTFVDANLLSELISSIYTEKPLLLGSIEEHRDGSFLDGGAGWLINDVVVKGLLAPVDKTMRWSDSHFVQLGEGSILDGCISRQQGGDWCFFPSDWAVVACVNSIGHGDVARKTGYMHSHKFLQSGLPPDTKGAGNFITAHHVDASVQLTLYAERRGHSHSGTS